MTDIKSVNSKEYIEWLCDFSELYPYFCSSTFVDLDDGVVSKEIQNNVSKMYKLYSEVEKYSLSHGLGAINTTYEIKYNGIAFRLSRRTKNPKEILCSRTDGVSLDTAIDFNNIIALEAQKEKENSIERIIESIGTLLNQGVSEEEIRSIINDCLEKEEVKKLVRKN